MSDSTQPFTLDEQKKLLLALLEECSPTPQLVDALAHVVSSIPDPRAVLETTRLAGRSFKAYKDELDNLIGPRVTNSLQQILARPSPAHLGPIQRQQGMPLQPGFRTLAPKEATPGQLGADGPGSTQTTTATEPSTKPKRGRPPKADTQQRNNTATARGGQRSAKRARKEPGPEPDSSHISSPSMMSTSTSPGMTISASSDYHSGAHPFSHRETLHGLAISTPNPTHRHPSAVSPYSAQQSYPSPGDYRPRMPESRSSSILNYPPIVGTPPGTGPSPPLSLPPGSRDLLSVAAPASPGHFSQPAPPAPSRYTNTASNTERVEEKMQE